MLSAVVVTRLIPSPVPDENNSLWANSGSPGPTGLDHTPNHRPSRAMMSPLEPTPAGRVSAGGGPKTALFVRLPVRPWGSWNDRTWVGVVWGVTAMTVPKKPVAWL